MVLSKLLNKLKKRKGSWMKEIRIVEEEEEEEEVKDQSLEMVRVLLEEGNLFSPRQWTIERELLNLLGTLSEDLVKHNNHHLCYLVQLRLNPLEEEGEDRRRRDLQLQSLQFSLHQFLELH
jgi:hypothetical protein